MDDIRWKPDYIFEVSWEVCNKVGGIHTVLITKARLLQEQWGNRLIMIGPDLPSGIAGNPEFTEDKNLFPTWKMHMQQAGLRVRAGRWNIPGNPLVILIDFTPFFQQKNEIFTHFWTKFRLDSLSGQWDYIEPAMFGYAAGKVIEGFYHCHLNATDHIIAQFHEWMTGTGILYVEENIPQVATVFTTHATVCGRAIAGSGSPFYSCFDNLNADQSARDFNVISKHSLEKIAATTADCFTSVSRFTAKECEKFLGKYPDVITPNGFDTNMVPIAPLYDTKRNRARNILLKVASALLGQQQPDDSLLVIKSGRYEYRNKGINTFIDAISLLNKTNGIKRNILAFIFVPANHTGPRKILLDNLLLQAPLPTPTGEVLTHNLQGADTDPILNHIRQQQLNNAPANHARIIYAPVYLDGADGIFNLNYYDTLIGFDLAIFPSYYEPWGYTPLESAAFHIPAVSTSLSGFSEAVGRLPGFNGKGIFIVERNDNNENAAAANIADIICNYAAETPALIAAARESAAHIAEQFLWDHLLTYYYQAYDLALQKSIQREQLFYNKPQVSPAETIIETIPASKPVWREITLQPMFPAALQPLQQISRNLWWSWNPEAGALYAYADKNEWRYKQNPCLLLKKISPASLLQLEKDKVFRQKLQTISAAYEKYTQPTDQPAPLVAYFCMEYGLHKDLKLYAGGLGVLAGDYIKAASDNRVNLVATGLLYKGGYFKQKISPDGVQLAIPDVMETENLPVYPVQNNQGEQAGIELVFPGRIVYAAIWKVAVGRVSLYLLDTDIAKNNEEDRLISARLYSSQPEMRLKQEILLGIGGVKMMEVLGIQPDLYHINEGHAAFTALERIHIMMQQSHLSFEEALEIVKNSTQFTTHTAVPAAMDIFDEVLLRTYFAYLVKDFNISWSAFMQLGNTGDEHNPGKFSMLNLAATLSQGINAVSKQHRGISCAIMQPLWKDFKPDELHITYITNGIHLPTWMASAWRPYYDDIIAGKAKQIPDNIIWNIRKKLKGDMWQGIVNRRQTVTPALYLASQKNNFPPEDLSMETLVIGFSRRFATYKRASLLFADIQRLTAIVNNNKCPVLIILAGKAHPDDADGIALLKKVITATAMPAFNVRVLFLEDYDMELAALLTQGVDLWLNTPEHNMEASGTSGMKAICNGVLHCSPEEGWWAEANRENAGWTLETSNHPEQDTYRERCDAAFLYDLLEKEIIPLFFDRNTEGLPEKWISMIKNGFDNITREFDMTRAIAGYNRCYRELYERSKLLLASGYKNTRELVAWKNRIRNAWHEIHVVTIEEPQRSNSLQSPGETFQARIILSIGTLHVNEISVEVVFYHKQQPDSYTTVQELTVETVSHDYITYSCQVLLHFTGALVYSFRVVPRHPLLPNRQDFPLMTWI